MKLFDSPAFLCSVTIAFFFFLGCIFGSFVGASCVRNEALSNNSANYHSNTGEFQWINASFVKKPTQ